MCSIGSNWKLLKTVVNYTKNFISADFFLKSADFRPEISVGAKKSKFWVFSTCPPLYFFEKFQFFFCFYFFVWAMHKCLQIAYYFFSVLISHREIFKKRQNDVAQIDVFWQQHLFFMISEEKNVFNSTKQSKNQKKPFKSDTHIRKVKEYHISLRNNMFFFHKFLEMNVLTIPTLIWHEKKLSLLVRKIAQVGKIILFSQKYT